MRETAVSFSEEGFTTYLKTWKAPPKLTKKGCNMKRLILLYKKYCSDKYGGKTILCEFIEKSSGGNVR